MSKRCEQCGQAVPEYSGIIADGERGEIRFAGRCVYLSKQEFEVFRFLFDKKGNVASKEAIYDHLYQLRLGGDDIGIKIVDVYVCKLRRILTPLGVEIGTVYGRGYFLKATERDASTST